MAVDLGPVSIVVGVLIGSAVFGLFVMMPYRLSVVVAFSVVFGLGYLLARDFNAAWAAVAGLTVAVWLGLVPIADEILKVWERRRKRRGPS